MIVIEGLGVGKNSAADDIFLLVPQTAQIIAERKQICNKTFVFFNYPK